MQITPLLIGQHLLGFVLKLVMVLVALYFASRIVTNQEVTLRAAAIGAFITAIVFEIIWFIVYFVIPLFPDWIALIGASAVLLALLLKYYDIGLASSIALVMLTIGILFAIIAFREAVLYLFLLPLPS